MGSNRMKVFGITGWKNSGKTTLVADLVRHMSGRGIRVSTVKHAHCDFDIDRPGTDSFKHREAGARQVLLASSHRWALMQEVGKIVEPELDELLQHLAPVDLVIVEGFKMADHPKIQVVRPQNNTERLPPETHPIVAIASDEQVNPTDYGCNGPLLDLNDIEAIANFILDYYGLTPG
jgi:molybdopterin-guanine dinucleotide biosynthesis protein MobB